MLNSCFVMINSSLRGSLLYSVDFIVYLRGKFALREELVVQIYEQYN